MEPVYRRTFQVDYFEKNERSWSILSRLSDDEHSIESALEVSVPEMIVVDAAIGFERFPLEPCRLVTEKASALKGMNIRTDFRKRIFETFMGPSGCPNVMNVLGVAVPGFDYVYYPHLVKTGRMKPEDWYARIKTSYANDCLAHTLIK